MALKWQIGLRRGLAAMLLVTLNSPSYLRAQERDPFVSIIDLEGKREVKDNIKLSNMAVKGIIWSKGRSVAIINDELVMPGENWKGFKVEAIEADKVILSDGENSYPVFVEQATAETPDAAVTKKLEKDPSEEERMRRAELEYRSLKQRFNK